MDTDGGRKTPRSGREPAGISPPVSWKVFPFFAAAAVLALAACAREGQTPALNLLLISLDTLRADHLGCYGYERPTSPFIDRLPGRDGAVLFENCFAQAPTTAPSHMTLFTSFYPTVHGVPDHTSKGGNTWKARLPAARTLAEVLKEAGYFTAAITDGGNLNAMTGLAEGFDTYHCRYEGAAKKVDQALEWLADKGNEEKPFFLFLHTYQVHAPYLPPPPFRDAFTGEYAGWIRDYCFGPEAAVEGKLDGFNAIFDRKDEFTPEDTAYLMALYDGEIAHTDQELARLWRGLEETHILEDTVVVLLSDHGEEFNEHDGFGHAQLYDEILHVPLVLMLPAGRFTIQRSRVQEPVSLIDVMPTLLDLLGMDAPSHLQGRSLTGFFQNEYGGKSVPVFAESIVFESPHPMVSAVRHERRKLINYMQGKHLRFYDLAADRLERKNLAPEDPEGQDALADLLDRWGRKNIDLRKRYKATFQEAGGKADAEWLRELKQLGY